MAVTGAKRVSKKKKKIIKKSKGGKNKKINIKERKVKNVVKNKISKKYDQEDVKKILSVKNQISKSVQDIRKKFKALKSGKEIKESKLLEKWSPLIKPIEQNVDRVADSVGEILKRKRLKKKKDKDDTISGFNTPEKLPREKKGKINATPHRAKQIKEAKEVEDDFYSQSDESGSLDGSLDDENIAGVDDGELISGLNPHLRHFVTKIQRGETENIDDVYGVKFTGKDWMIGNSLVTFDRRDIYVGEERFEATRGLFELMFAKEPDESFVTKDDMGNYKRILEISNAHRKTYSADKAIMGNKGFKYISIISKLFPPKSKKTGSGVSMDARQHVCHYYDDVNDLVDRLRLLWASTSAGHNAHTNEVNSIMSELREAHVIK